CYDFGFRLYQRSPNSIEDCPHLRFCHLLAFTHLPPPSSLLLSTPLEPCFMSDPLMTSFTHRSHTPVVASIAPAEAPLLRRYPRISGKLLKFGSSSSVIISRIKSPSGSSVSSALASHPLKPLFLSPFPFQTTRVVPPAPPP